MVRASNPNLLMLEAAVERLGAMVDEFVFLGGCATGLLIEDLAAPPIRETIDVDVIVRVLTKGEYYALADRLHRQGFKEDTSDDAPICRWTDGVVLLDVMPVDPSILGFGNEWYAPAMESAVEISLPGGKSIRMVSAPYFLVTKLEAFEQRGEGDYQMSHDIEDIVAVMDGRPLIVEEVNQSEMKLRDSLRESFHELLNTYRFIDAVSGHMPTDEVSQARVPVILERMSQISKLKKL